MPINSMESVFKFLHLHMFNFFKEGISPANRPLTSPQLESSISRSSNAFMPIDPIESVFNLSHPFIFNVFKEGHSPANRPLTSPQLDSVRFKFSSAFIPIDFTDFLSKFLQPHISNIFKELEFAAKNDSTLFQLERAKIRCSKFGTPLNEMKSESIIPWQSLKSMTFKFGRSPSKMMETRLTLEDCRFNFTRFGNDRVLNGFTLITRDFNS